MIEISAGHNGGSGSNGDFPFSLRPSQLADGTQIFALSVTSLPARLLAADDTTALFRELCSVCHGVGGKGDGPSAQGLEAKPADFTDCKALAKDSDDVLFKIIKGGGQSAGRSNVMPTMVNINYDPLDAVRLMRNRGVRRLPIVDEHRQLLGIVTMDDLLMAFSTEIGDLAGPFTKGLGWQRLQLRQPETRRFDPQWIGTLG